MTMNNYDDCKHAIELIRRVCIAYMYKLKLYESMSRIVLLKIFKQQKYTWWTDDEVKKEEVWNIDQVSRNKTVSSSKNGNPVPTGMTSSASYKTACWSDVTASKWVNKIFDRDRNISSEYYFTLDLYQKLSFQRQWASLHHKDASMSK